MKIAECKAGVKVRLRRQSVTALAAKDLIWIEGELTGEWRKLNPKLPHTEAKVKLSSGRIEWKSLARLEVLGKK